MLEATRRWRDEVGDTYILGAVRVALGLLLFANGLRAARELEDGYFGDWFHWPMLPEALVPSRTVYVVMVAAQVTLAALVVAGSWARPALLVSALLGFYVVLCDRLQFHHNRYALFCYALLLSLAPCDRSFFVAGAVPGTRAGPLWAARLMQVQLCLVYVASGGSKLLDADWRSGRVLLERFQLFGERALAAHLPVSLTSSLGGSTEADIASMVAKLAIATELLLAVGLWSRYFRIVALWWGVWFHLIIQATSRVEGFTWLTMAVYALFCEPDLRGRRVVYDGDRLRGRLLGRSIRMLDWLARFDVKPWVPDDIRRGHTVVVVCRDGTHLTGISALAMVARCTPLLFPLWAPLVVVAACTKGGDAPAAA